MKNAPFVWHDLMTSDIERSKQFYKSLLGWSYEIEHATDFAWGSGEADYPLIVQNGTAHGGIIEISMTSPSYWLPYLQVRDVESITATAERLGAKIERAPFDVPGVGRNAVIRDPQGALICPHTPTHSFPPPVGVFDRDLLFTPDPNASQTFYVDLFGIMPQTVKTDDLAAKWICIFPVEKLQMVLEQVEALDGKVTKGNQISGQAAIVADPTGAEFGLIHS